MAKKKTINDMSYLINNNSFENKFDFLSTKYRINYLTYLLFLDGKKVFSYSSNEKWSKVYLSENLHKNCQLIKFGHNKKDKNFYLEWKRLKPATKDELLVHEARRDHAIGDGVSICFNHKIHQGQLLESIAFAPDSSNRTFNQEMRIKQVEFFKDFKDMRDNCLQSSISSL